MRFIGLKNYLEAFQDKIFWVSFKNNLLLILAMTVVPIILALLLSVILFEFVARRIGSAPASFFRAGFYVPQVIAIVDVVPKLYDGLYPLISNPQQIYLEV